ncbi:MAG: 4-hydroxy-tetrahydrodipicolinate synthase [Oscillospiraceae bacterium]|nr:4-hydroxy-tetrahydrodipicolinate synthase [Oscillospiraceae bacterium]
MKKCVFTGCATALVTPFRDGVIDEKALAGLIDWQIAGGCSALVIAGTTGESAVLSYREHRALVGFSARRTSGRVPVIAGAGSNSTEHALTLVRQAEDAGADALLLVTPYYNKTSQSGLLRHFTYLADRTELPVLLYDVPSRTGMRIEPETLAELSRHPRIVGVKEAGTDLDAVSRAMALCGEDFSFYSGNDSLTLPLMALGAKGVISVASNLAPEAMSELTRLCLAGDYRDAAALHFEYLALMDALFMDVNPIPVKAAMAAAGLCSGELRLPLTELGADKQARLLAVLRRYGAAAD